MFLYPNYRHTFVQSGARHITAHSEYDEYYYSLPCKTIIPMYGQLRSRAKGGVVTVPLVVLKMRTSCLKLNICRYFIRGRVVILRSRGDYCVETIHLTRYCAGQREPWIHRA